MFNVFSNLFGKKPVRVIQAQPKPANVLPQPPAPKPVLPVRPIAAPSSPFKSGGNLSTYQPHRPSIFSLSELMGEDALDLEKLTSYAPVPIVAAPKAEKVEEKPQRQDSASRELKHRFFLNGQMLYPSPHHMIIIDKPDWDEAKCGKLMVSIGVKDKNDKDIYHGDILKVKSDLFEDVEYIEVSFWRGGYWLGEVAIYDFDEEELEVVGNVFQHRHLLT